MTRSAALATGVLVALGSACRCGEQAPPPPALPPPPPVVVERPAPPPPPPAPSAVVVSRSGGVEVRRGEGAWGPVSPGDRLQAADAIRTQEDGELEIAVDEIRVRVYEHSELKVKALTDKVIRAQLTGRLSSEVPEGAGRVEIEATGADAVAVAEAGRFSMLSDGRGVVAVAAVKGEVKLSSAGRVLQVAEGQVAKVRPGRPLEPPTSVLRQVLLSVDWPDQRETNRRSFKLAGRVEAGTRVMVQGRLVDVEPSGKFETRVSLRQGKQRVAVTAVDVLGRKKQQREGFLMDETLPDVKVKGRLWE